MYAEDALDVLGLGIGLLKRWEHNPKKALRIFKIALKKAFKYRAFETHPDRNSGKDDEFRKVNGAYDYLKHVDEEFLKEMISSLPSSQRQQNPKRIRKIYVEWRGGNKIKVTLISPHGISISFLNASYSWASRREKKDVTPVLVKALKDRGIIASYDDPGAASNYEYRIVEV